MPDAAESALPLSEDEAARLLAPFLKHERIALAVSGGADSMALMALSARWARGLAKAPELVVLSVDHGLRAQAAQEAQGVCATAARLGLECHVLRWRGKKPQSGIQQAARQARYGLMGEWCAAHGAALATAHNMEDQAETLLMRLARGSGLRGLAAMAPQGALEGRSVVLLRPFLGVARARLEATLRAFGMNWVEDPSNADEGFERVRIRRLLADLAEAGIAAPALARSAARLGRAEAALEHFAGAATKADLSCHDTGWGELKLEPFRARPAEIRIRVLSALVSAFGAGGPVRLAAVEDLDAWLRTAAATGAGHGRTLGGTRLARRRRNLVIGREPGRLAARLALSADRPEGIWDRRFALRAEGLRETLHVLPLLKAGLPAGFPSRPKDMPAFVWQGLPVLCRGERAVACPPLGWRAADAPFSALRWRFLPCGHLPETS